MSYLLDTNVVSEWVKPRPDAGVVEWLGEVDEDRAYISVVTLAELRRGVERLPKGRRRRRLDSWIDDELLLRFDGRILPIDSPVADAWGRLVVRREASGRPIGSMDAFIAATSLVHDLILVTRNTADFAATLPRMINPWTS